MSYYVRCLNNEGYEASLTQGNIYKILPYDGDQASLRVIDNSGEDYLYAKRRFEFFIAPSHSQATESLTLHLDPFLKGVLQAEAIAARKSMSALLRDWVEEHLDLPTAA